MQLFNGLNMGILSSYRINNEGNPSEAPSPETYENSKNEQLNKIKNEIKELNDGENTDNDKIEIQGILTTEFANYLKSNPQIAQSLSSAVNSISVETDSENYKAVQNLKAFLESIIGKSFNGGNNTFDTSKLNGINTTVEQGDFSSKIDKAKVEAVKTRISDNLLKKYASVLDSTTEGENIKKILEKVSLVLDNPVEKNVQILQQVIFENLNTEEKKQFFEKNGSGDIENPIFDGKFGISTLEWTNKGIDTVENRLKVLKETQDIINSNETGNIKPRNNIKIPQGGELSPKNWLEGLSPEAKVSIKDGNSIDTNKPGEQNVTLVVDEGGKVSEITVKVTVEGNTEPVAPQPTLDTTPLTIPVGNENKVYRVMENSLNIVQNAKLNGATFFSINEFAGERPAEGTPWGPEKIPEGNGDYECLMKMKNAEEIYKVKIDRNGNLCPIIENYISKSKKRVLLKNNPSCVAYLQNKIPAGLPGNPKIDWHSGEEDYVIKTTINGKQKIMTIEPMEIDGHGVSPDLSEHLIMMNFVHFLRLNNTIDDVDFNNKDDPDLRLNDRGKLEVRVDRKSNRTYDKNGKVIKNGRWYEVPESPDRFGLGRITENREEKFKNLIKFNNGEHWEDNWDNKDENKYYGKIALEGEAEVISQPFDPNNTINITPNDPNNTINTTETTVTQETKTIENINLKPDVLSKLESKGVVVKGADDKYTYDSEKLNSYLSEFKDKSRSELATDASYIAAVQILLNEKSGANDEKLAINGELNESTQGKVRKFQEEYNNSSNIKLKLDGKPGKYTLAALLGNELVNPANTSETPSTINNRGSVNAETGNQDPENVTKYGLRWDALSNKKKEKTALGIPANKIVYIHPNIKDKVFYKSENGSIFGIPKNRPYFLEKYKLQNPPVMEKFNLNVCQSGANKFNNYLIGTGSNVSILPGSLGNNEYKLNVGNSSITLYDNILNKHTSAEFFGISTLHERLRALSLALSASNKCKGINFTRKDLYIDTNGDLVCENLLGYPTRTKEKIFDKSTIDAYKIVDKGNFVKYIKKLSIY